VRATTSSAAADECMLHSRTEQGRAVVGMHTCESQSELEAASKIAAVSSSSHDQSSSLLWEDCRQQETCHLMPSHEPSAIPAHHSTAAISTTTTLDVAAVRVTRHRLCIRNLRDTATRLVDLRQHMQRKPPATMCALEIGGWAIPARGKVLRE
jgi:hypothetical protein